MFRVIGQAGVLRLLNLRMFRQDPGQRHGGRALPLQSKGEGLHASQRQPRLERTGRAPLFDGQVADMLDQLARTGHRSADMVRRYIREGSLFRDNAASLVGL